MLEKCLTVIAGPFSAVTSRSVPFLLGCNHCTCLFCWQFGLIYLPLTLAFVSSNSLLDSEPAFVGYTEYCLKNNRKEIFHYHCLVLLARARTIIIGGLFCRARDSLCQWLNYSSRQLFQLYGIQ